MLTVSDNDEDVVEGNSEQAQMRLLLNRYCDPEESYLEKNSRWMLLLGKMV